ncbi:hypothetical protein EAF00_006032 [Botryotinia globosa]|nr:hypothetical protein EAF00_006032 [Botryotinia globosa]
MVTVVIHPIESNDSTEESTTPILFDKLSANFDLSSQVPKLMIHIDEYAVSPHVHNFVLANADLTDQTADDCIFKHLHFGAHNPANWSIAGIQSEFADVLDTPGLTFDQAVELYKFGRGVLNEKSDDNVNEKAGAGFLALNFTIKGRISPPRLRDDCVPNNDSEVRALKFQRTLKKGNFVFTLVRKFGNFSDDLDAYWKHRVAICSRQGLWPIFNGHVTETPGRRFKDWYTNPTKFLPHEPWMAEAPAERSENGIQRFVTQNARNNFGSMTEWEIVYSAAVIHDVAASIKLNDSSEGKVAVQDVVIDGINSIEWNAQVLVAENKKQFVISFIMPHGKKRKFHVGSKVDVQLKVLNNHLAMTRQLKPIGMNAENKAKDDTYGRILQRFILGEAAETALSLILNATRKLFEAVDNAAIGVHPAPELLTEIKESKENFGIIHFPANASTENDFMKRDDERKAGEEDNALDTYRISNHVIKSFQRKANNPESSNTIRTKATTGSQRSNEFEKANPSPQNALSEKNRRIEEVRCAIWGSNPGGAA